jgi:hypothetical protein
MNRLLRILGIAVLGLVVLGFAVHYDVRRTHLIAAAVWGRQTDLARAFVSHGAAADSLALVHLSTAPQPVVWALTFGRTEPRTARVVAQTLRPVWGSHRGPDTLLVEYDAEARWCPARDEPNVLQLVYVRLAGRWRIAHAGVESC